MASKQIYKVDYSSLNTYESARNSMLNFLKKFYPNDYKNFESGKAGGMILDAMAFSSSILQFNQGQYFNQAFPQTVTDKQKAINLASWYGMKNFGATLPWVGIKATISVSAIGGEVNSTHIPKILPGATIYSSDHSTPNFYLSNKIDFTKIPSNQWTKYYNTNGSLKRVEISAYGFVTTYDQNEIAHTITTQNGDTFEKFYEVTLPKFNVQQISSIVDQNGIIYYEVDSLVNDTIFDFVLNDNDVQNNIPYLIFEKTAKNRFIRQQFVSNTDEQIYTKLTFGNISESEYQEKLFNVNPNDLVLPNNLAGLDGHSSAIQQLTNRSYDPENLLLVDSLGVGPSNGDVLTIKYLSGGGASVKVNSGKLNRIRNITWSWNDNTQSSDIIASLNVNNDEPSAGGRDALSTEEIKQNTTRFGLNQKRCVTPQDYMGVILSMPEYLGRPDKVTTTRSQDSDRDPFKFNVHMVSIDSEGHFFDPTKNPAFINNMRLYLKRYKGLNDFVVLRQGKVLNFKFQFDIRVHKDFQPTEVSFNALQRAKEFFNKNNWDFGQSLDIDDFIQYIKNNVNGIVFVGNAIIRRPTGADQSTYPYNYSNQNLNFNYKENAYKISGDSILEIRYPDKDISVNVDIAV